MSMEGVANAHFLNADLWCSNDEYVMILILQMSNTRDNRIHLSSDVAMVIEFAVMLTIYVE
jgi:hypothetical protein